MKRVLAMILAGGRGERLDILTQVRAKPAVPFAGSYRMVDFSLSNCVNSGIYNVAVLTQYRPRSLQNHIGIGKPWDLDRQGGGVRLLQPYLGRKDSDWYKGTADAVYQNLYHVEEQNVDLVLILSGDHIYKMDYVGMITFHEQTGANLTIGVTEVPLKEAQRFGTLTVETGGEVLEFLEKPKQPKSNVVSMGVYLFNKRTLLDRLEEDASDITSSHDFGRSVLPRMIGESKVYAYPFKGYWRDVGTIQAYWEAHMDLLKAPPLLDLYDDWVIHTNNQESAPTFISNTAEVSCSLISYGCTIEGRVEDSVLSPGVRVARSALVKESIIMFDSVVKEGSVIDRSILDKEVVVGEGCHLGFGEGDSPLYTETAQTDGGITVIGKKAMIPPGAIIGRSCRIFPGVTTEDFPGLVVKSGDVVKPRAGQPLVQTY